MNNEQTDDSQILQAIDKMLTVLRNGLQEPFILYTTEVMQRLMKDIPLMEQTPEWAMLHTVPNNGKIYYGDDVQMVELIKKRIQESEDVDQLVDWCEQWADLIVRTQYKQPWCQGEVAKCVRLFRDQQVVPQEFTKNAKVCVTFDSLCGTAFVLKHTQCEITKQLLLSNFMNMAKHCIKIQETFIETVRSEYQKQVDNKKNQQTE